MKIAVDIFPTDQTINPVEFARAAEELGFESHLVPRALPHPDEPPVTVGRPRGRAAAARVLPPHLRPVRRARRVRGRHLDGQAGDRDLPRRPTRPDPHRQGGRHRRRPVRRADDLRHRLRLEQGGDGAARHEVRRASSAAARADPGDEGAVDEDEASFDGDHVQIEPSWAWPKPAQHPHPPIVLGGAAGPKTAADIAEFCDGWMPIGCGQLKTGWDEVQRACDDIGRDPAAIELGVFNAPARRGQAAPSSPSSA